MKYLIIAFKSRTQLQNFAKTLRLYGLNVSVINTPRSISISCGLSIRTEYHYLSTIKTILLQSQFESLLGIYSITRNGLYEQIEKVY